MRSTRAGPAPPGPPRAGPTHPLAPAGRKPALLDSFFQSLVLAPFFVYMEVGFFLGFRQEFHKQLRDEVGKRRVAWRKSLKAEGKAT